MKRLLDRILNCFGYTRFPIVKFVPIQYNKVLQAVVDRPGVYLFYIDETTGETRIRLI